MGPFRNAAACSVLSSLAQVTSSRKSAHNQRVVPSQFLGSGTPGDHRAERSRASACPVPKVVTTTACRKCHGLRHRGIHWTSRHHGEPDRPIRHAGRTCARPHLIDASAIDHVELAGECCLPAGHRNSRSPRYGDIRPHRCHHGQHDQDQPRSGHQQQDQHQNVGGVLDDPPDPNGLRKYMIQRVITSAPMPR